MNKKLNAGVMAVCMLLVAAISVTVWAGNAVTVNASQQRLAKEQIVFIPLAELEAATGSALSGTGVSTFAGQLTGAAVWLQLGFSEEEAGMIAARAEQFPGQLETALNAISADATMQLKIILPADGKVFIGYGTREGRIFDELPPDYDGEPIQ